MVVKVISSIHWDLRWITTFTDICNWEIHQSVDWGEWKGNELQPWPPFRTFFAPNDRASVFGNTGSRDFVHNVSTLCLQPTTVPWEPTDFCDWCNAMFFHVLINFSKANVKERWKKFCRKTKSQKMNRWVIFAWILQVARKMNENVNFESHFRSTWETFTVKDYQIQSLV